MIKYMHKTYRMGEKFFPGIQALRALAALIVTYGHVLHEALTMRGGEVMSYIPYPTSVGIDAFFAISGFVIYISGYKLIDETNGYISFLKKRFVRVVPLYWFYTTLMLLVILILPGAVGTAQADFWHVVQSYLFIPHERPHGDGLKPLLALGWTLNYEIYFYAIFALVMAFVKSRFLAVFIPLFHRHICAGHFIPYAGGRFVVLVSSACAGVFVWCFDCRDGGKGYSSTTGHAVAIYRFGHCKRGIAGVSGA